MELYNEIINWIGDTFGKNRDPEMLLSHLREEMDELELAVSNYRLNPGANTVSDMLSEYADVQILLWNLMNNFGICKSRMDDAIVIKHNINRKRRWVMKDGKTVHVEIVGDAAPVKKTYYCVVCGRVPVDVENGYDTCPDCSNRI